MTDYSDLPPGWFPDKDIETYQTIVSGYQNAIMVEVGVWLGRSLCSIMPIAIKHNIKVFAVDDWSGGTDKIVLENIKGVANPYESFQDNLRGRGYLDKIQIIKMDSVEAAATFGGKTVDILMIDANHSYDSVHKDIIAWKSRIREDGVMLGHDWNLDSVKNAVRDTVGEPDETIGQIWIKRGWKKHEPII